MKGLVSLASMQGNGPSLKEVRAGVPHKEGEIAYFLLMFDPNEPSYSGVFWQYEEWKELPEGGFSVTITRMAEKKASRWIVVLGAPARGITEEVLDITSTEVIAKSERTQKLLLEGGKPVFVGGVTL